MRSHGNDTLFRVTKDETILKMIDEDIAQKQREQSEDFHSKEAIVITFNGLQSFNNWNSSFRYQAVLSTNYKKTYAIFKYDRIDAPGNGNIGFHEPNLKSPCNATSKFDLDERNLTESSNIGKPGTFVFLLTRYVLKKINLLIIILFVYIITDWEQRLYVFPEYPR